MGCNRHKAAKLVRDVDSEELWKCAGRPTREAIEDGAIDEECGIPVCPDHDGRSMLVQEAGEDVVVFICIKCRKRYEAVTEAGAKKIAAEVLAEKEKLSRNGKPFIEKEVGNIGTDFEMPPGTSELLAHIRTRIGEIGKLSSDEVLVVTVGLVPHVYVLNLETGIIKDRREAPSFSGDGDE